jgi:S-adenosylmethionine:tRNA ribosyltransferase-isomerase
VKLSKKADISIKDFTYHLPDEQVAKYALTDRDQSKLLVWNNGSITDDRFYNLQNHLSSGSMLVFNNTRVIKARIIFRKKTGARIELFCLEPISPPEYSISLSQTESCRWKCIVGNLKKWKDGSLELNIIVKNQPVKFRAKKVNDLDDAQEILFSWDNNQISFAEIIEASGNIPIPPYLNRESEEIDLISYQTVYSKIKGSVAAPTAGLHFTDGVLESLEKKNIACEELTLHVGAGTFQPVKSATIFGHKMHTEHFIVSLEFIEKICEQRGKIIAVGTTSVRTLESLYWMGCKIIDFPSIEPANLTVKQWEPYQNDNQYYAVNKSFKALLDFMKRNNLIELNTSTQIIIIPGYDFKVISGMITNFHQPQSTLLLLIAAFLGEEWEKIYEHALINHYRFLSYGDSNLYIK